MKKTTIVFTLALITVFSSYVSAQQPIAGGFTGPSLAKLTVAEALKLSDDTPVVLEGKIEKNLGGEKYLFKDNTASVTVEIDNDEWRGITVNEQDIIEIRGEVDKDLMNFEIDIDSISKK